MLRVIALLAAAALAGCGGGGSSSTSTAVSGGTPAPAPAPAPTPAPAPGTALVITDFTPTTGPVGTVVTITGTGLDGAAAATIGSVAATLQAVSATQVRITVPSGAASGRIGVSGGGRVALSASNFVVTTVAAPAPAAVPAVTSVSPTTVAPGGRLTLTGTALDQVASARLGSVALPIASASATQLLLDVPGNATSGTLSLTDRAGTARTVAQPITVQVPLAVTSVAPATVARGQPLTLTGRGLDRVTSVRFAGPASADVASRSGTTSVTVNVPTAAISGAVTAVAGTETAASATSLTIIDAIVVTPQAYTAPAAGSPVTINGSGLAAVTSVSVAGTAASITGQTAGALTFSAPAGVNCGPIVLASPAQASVAAGTLAVGSGCSLSAAGLEFAQVMSYRTSDTYQRLAAARETWVRAFIVSASAGTPAPVVRALGFGASGQALGSVTLTGPTTLPQLASGSAVPDAMRYDDAQAFRAELPLAWIQPGLRVRVEAADASIEGTPTVAATGGLQIVLVPLVSGSNVPVMPALDDALAELRRRLPLPADRISIRIRAAYPLTSVTTGVQTSAQWSAALNELEQLRDAEAPNALYYGMVRPMVTAGTAGIGYVNNIGSSSPSLSSLGWDASRSAWAATMIHELGHNFSRQHAPCGGVSGADASYPYASGALGTTPLFDALADDVIAPTGQSDVMGYCRGTWFSDYNLNGVQRFLESRPAAMRNAAAVIGAEADQLVIGGVLDDTGSVRLATPRAARSAEPRDTGANDAGALRLRIVTRDGSVIEQRFDPVEVDHAGERHFTLRLPHPGPVERIEVRRGADVIGQRVARARAQAAPGESTATWATVQPEGDSLVLRWNDAAHPTASLVHAAADGTRRALAIDATGGRWVLGAEASRTLPPGGRFEVSVSDGLDATLLTIAR